MKKRFITAAFPYPNSPQHIGHGRTYTIADVYAKYSKINGMDVLFPMAFHVTGTPIIAMAKRIEKEDESVLKVFEEIYGISREKAKELTDPRKLVLYFSNEIEQGMKEMNYGIDWSRKFYTFDPHFNKFIQWQFRKLYEKGLIKKGEYALAYCPADKNVLSSHDTKGDVDPEIEEVVLIKFRSKKGILLASTYRPETLYGLTNVWIRKDIPYVKIKIKGEEGEYIIAKDVLKDFRFQKELEVIDEIDGKELEGLIVKSPLGQEVKVYHSKLVKPNIGTGIVMSVPGHAPYDYVGVKQLIENGEHLEIKKIIESKIKIEEVDKLGIKDVEDERLEKLTKEIYNDENKRGKMIVEEYKGMPVKEAKELIKKRLIENKDALNYYILANEVYCRCGEKGVVKIFDDQWFIDYSNKEWKQKALECLRDMKIYPEKARKELEYAISWLKEKPCTRNSGFGTKFPFDETKVIEPLSDSTIYMAFYTISHILKEMPLEEINDELFDYIYYGKGTAKNKKWEEMREQFLKWYPLDSRHSGADLTMNHLPFFIFNHVAIFPKEHWPKQIVVNGFVMMDGKKMSKSMGNILPLRKAIKDYGADVIRIAILSGSSLAEDSNFSKDIAEGLKNRLEWIYEFYKKQEDGEQGDIEEYMWASLMENYEEIKKNYESFNYREIIRTLIYDVYRALRWYEKRVDAKGSNYKLKKWFKIWASMVYPFIPELAEKINNNIKYPTKQEYNKEAIEREQYIEQIIKDIKIIKELREKKEKDTKKINIYLAKGWKRKISDLAKEHGMKVLGMLKEEIKDMKLAGKIAKMKIKISKETERKAIIDGKELIEKETGVKIELKEKDHEKALPSKPALIVEE